MKNKIKDKSNNIKQPSIEDIKLQIEKAEERYKASFKTYSCKEIMDSYYALQRAKKLYSNATGISNASQDDIEGMFSNLENCDIDD